MKSDYVFRAGRSAASNNKAIVVIVILLLILLSPVIISAEKERALNQKAEKAQRKITTGYKRMMAEAEVFRTDNMYFLCQCNKMKDVACVSTAHKRGFPIVKDTASGLSAADMPAAYLVTGGERNSNFKWSEVPYMFQVKSGMTFGVIPDSNYQGFAVVVDLNGPKGPNMVGKDLVKYRLRDFGVRLLDLTKELGNASKY